MILNAKNRYQAFGIHIIISAIIFLLLASIIMFIWYPGFLFQTDGGWQGVRLIAGIDFIIGPTLTLIVYKIGKPGLKFDLIFIGLLQFTCLIAGLSVVYQEKPLAIIFIDGTYQTMSKDSFDFHDIDFNEAFKMDNKIPAWVYLDLPQDKDKRKEILKYQIRDGLLHSRVELYLPYKDNLNYIMQEKIEFSEINKDITDKMTASGVLFYYKARYEHGYIEINKDTGDYITIHPSQ